MGSKCRLWNLEFYNYEFGSVQNAGRVTDNSQMEYEAKSARDGAWLVAKDAYLTLKLIEVSLQDLIFFLCSS